ncbi:unnamed protein product [Linum tenue]|uniref:DUF4005 domain-containing protein n=1 Tax=Linum tenue TaxID=586396 RepID=A0AAV0IUU3_9ROSI|nr:unnamed protein product [Linum tenue]
MADSKGGCWYGWMKKIFTCHLAEKKLKRGKWKWVSRRLRLLGQNPVIPAPTTQLTDATERQKNYALTVAMAAAAAAEAAVAAAKAASELVRLTVPHGSSVKRDRNRAAILIQSVFRAYLARKALRALRGVVKLQAIVRGELFRRRQSAIINKLKHLIVLDDGVDDDCKSAPIDEQEEKEFKQGRADHQHSESTGHSLRCSSQRSWDFSRLSKEELEAVWLRKQEGSMKRDRMMSYSFSHQERMNSQLLEELLMGEKDQRSNDRHWMENLRILPFSTSFNSETEFSSLTKTSKDSSHHTRGRGSSSSVARDDDNDSDGESSRTTITSSSVVLPTYMAATESARARARSVSMPRQRVGVDREDGSRGGMTKVLWSSDSGELFGKSYANKEMVNRKCHHRGFSLASRGKNG